MAITIPSDVRLDDRTVTGPVSMPGGELIYGFAYAEYGQLRDQEEVETVQIDLFSPTDVSPGLVALAMGVIRSGLYLEGRDIVAYAMYRAPAYDVSLPDQFCIAALCWPNPLGKVTLATVWQYRLWFLHRSTPPIDARLDVRPDARAQIGLGVLIAIIVGGLLLIMLLPGIVSVLQGKITWHQMLQGWREFLLPFTPGEQLKAPIVTTTLPLMAFGFVLVATAVVMPEVISKLRLHGNLGPVGGEVELGAGGGSGRKGRP